MSTTDSNFEPTVEIPNKLYFRIGEVADIVGVDSHVLRYWEKELEMKPHRSNSGQRLYRKVDIIQFLRIRHLIHNEGYTIGGAKQAMSERNSTTIPLEQLKSLQSQLQEIQKELSHLKRTLWR